MGYRDDLLQSLPTRKLTAMTEKKRLDVKPRMSQGSRLNEWVGDEWMIDGCMNEWMDDG